MFLAPPGWVIHKGQGERALWATASGYAKQWVAQGSHCWGEALSLGKQYMDNVQQDAMPGAKGKGSREATRKDAGQPRFALEERD